MSLSTLGRLRQRREVSQEMAGALVATRVDVEVLLVVRLRVPPLAGWQNFCGNATLPPLFVDLLRDLLCNLLLLIVVVEDGAAVLCANIRSLTVLGCGVVHLVEELEERAVFDLGWVVDYLERLSVCESQYIFLEGFDVYARQG